MLDRRQLLAAGFGSCLPLPAGPTGFARAASVAAGDASNTFNW
jgi:hypothetical protein